ncbi:ABC transporter ATP-binding protein [Brevibacillus brevis X23]|nr:ABC transporter ATP-binding protein [Brevibacillus brevis X23]
MSNHAIKIANLGKLYRLYSKPIDKVLDVFGLNFWRKDYYQEFWALRDLSVEIKKGERIGLIGRNGAGKSTLLKTIIGNVTPTEGTLEVKGNIQALMELGTGFHPEFTGRQNIKAALSYLGLSDKQIQEKEEEIIDFSELEEFIDQPIKTYSAGMYARLAFSTATSIEPEILIIDEVLGAGDAYFAGKCVERMQKLTAQSGATVLFVSHDLNSVLQLCDRVIWIDRGRIRQDGKPLEVIKNYNAMIRKEEEIRLRARDLKIQKKQAALLESMDDLFQSVLFHFVGENGKPPKGSCRVYQIKLLSGTEEIGTIDVGGPMDNSSDQMHYIMDTKGYMDWGPSLRDANGYYREYKNLGGKYCHAPFEYKVPKVYLQNLQELSLQVTAQVAGENVNLEVFDGIEYRQLGALIAGEFTTYEFIVPPQFLMNEEMAKTGLEDKGISMKENEEEEVRESEVLRVAELSEYGSKEARIVSVRMLNESLHEAKIFETRKPVQVVIEYESNIDMVNPVFVFCIYMSDGKVASQWIADTKESGIATLPRKGAFSFDVDELLIGRGKYVASAAIFKTLTKSGVEAESYHVLDRSIHFEIVQSLEDNIEKGLCLQPFGVKLSDAKRQPTVL